MPIAYLEPTGTFKVLTGAGIRVRVEGFPANTAVTLTMASMEDAAAARPIGGTATDEQGKGVAAGVIPADARLGDAIVQAIASDACAATNYVFVVASLEGIGIDDDTVEPGQQVTIRAGGFHRESTVSAHLDGNPGDALCECPQLALAHANAAGFVEILVRIPDDVSSGDHVIFLAGDDPDGASDLFLPVAITVNR